MRWIVLALSLGTAIVSIIIGVIGVLWMLYTPDAASQAAGIAGNDFSWLTAIVLFISVVLSLPGGIMGFHRRRAGGFFLILAAGACFLARGARIFGAFYLAAGLLAFLLKNPSYNYRDYEDDESEDDDRDDDYEDEDPEDRGVEGDEDFLERNAGRGRSSSPGSNGMRRRERVFASRMFKEDKTERMIDEEDEIYTAIPVRRRASKVCPACGASVGVGHRFCFVCGKALHTRAEDADAETARREDFSPEETDGPTSEEHEGTNFREVPIRSFSSSQKAESWRAESEPGEAEERYGEEESHGEGETTPENLETPFTEDSEISSPHRVFVKPTKEEGAIPRRPLHIAPDNSYKEFSHYTRRRKRKNRSLFRRILGPVVLLLAVGGAAWFLMGGFQRGPSPLPPTLPPTPSTPADQQKPAVPDEPIVPVKRDPLTELQILAPSRGVVTGSNVNVRADHSTGGSVVARLSADVRLDLLNRWEGTTGTLTGPWYQVRTGGKEGWIYGQYFQPLDARPASLPEGYTDVLLKTFGANKEDAVKHLGRPSRETASAFTWSGLTMNFRGESDIARLQVTSAQHVLQNGLAIGITDEALYKNMGYPSEWKGGQLRYLESEGRGVGIRMRSGRVQSITVGNI
ncbi:MAG: SH3 domain-containing protein [Synergistaceae bacterium]|nr:SH3 domain-containing protein [Synergistaceae bacterium]